ncbi:lysosome-associated membrane glycoprotein 5 [Biomphalaria pfeifferi]|uniref:Lysosome-associated membrane glycoprotein 5 n=1 Tax=Biomphalaria pfeifferi TaxID=112525 RepID=A0AAD8BAP7_BIOPF|nr:lysosome-associated membrane glycoprotein 5 [Biomphalaria pfeifferi]
MYIKFRNRFISVILVLAGRCSYSHGNGTVFINLEEPMFGITDTVKFGSEDGSGEGEITGSEDQGTALPHLVVADGNGHPCLLATLNATLQVYYRVPEVIVHETYIAFADIQLPVDVSAQGVCAPDASSLLLDWGNATFDVNMTFTRKVSEIKGENSTWSLTSISVTYNLSNTDIFKASTTKETVTVDRQRLSLFGTQVGNTHACDQDIDVQLGSIDRGVKLTFHNVNIAAFGVTSRKYPEGIDYCLKTDHYGPGEEILVPLTVASILSFFAVSIVIGYVITRKLIRIKEQNSYKQMA